MTGHFCLEELLRDAAYDRVVALVRRPIAITHAKLKVVQADFEHLEGIEQEIAGIEDVFCCLGTTIAKAGTRDAFRRVDFEYPLSLAKVARRGAPIGFC